MTQAEWDAATPRGRRLDFTDERYEEGHIVTRAFAEWNVYRQEHCFVIVHSGRCPGCRLENRLAKRKGRE